MAVWVTPSSAAARVKLLCRAATSKASSAFSDGKGSARLGRFRSGMRFSHLAGKRLVRARLHLELALRGMKLFRLRYSPFARKVQMLLELIPLEHELVE